MLAPPEPSVGAGLLAAMSEGQAVLLGTILGAIISLVGNWLVWLLQHRDEENRWRREDGTRFHDDRRILYAKFLALANDLFTMLAGSDPLEPVVATGLKQLSQLQAEISLIASRAVRENAAAIAVVIAAAFMRREPFQANQEVHARYLALEEDLRAAARKELGILEENVSFKARVPQ